MYYLKKLPLLIAVAMMCVLCSHQTKENNDMNTINKQEVTMNDFLKVQSKYRSEAKEGIKAISNNWDDSFIFPLIEMMRFIEDEWAIEQVDVLLKKHFNVEFKGDFFQATQWLWTQEKNYPTFYGNLKGEFYQYIDPKFKQYFVDRQDNAEIRFDEILWGGVVQDGIPPLRYPEYSNADEAFYLNDSDVVFGFTLNGVSRAYPKRILAWHEFFVDDFGGTKIAGVYCTLCGTVIAYDMTHDGVFHDLGTSGFLYRSNKVMYDKATQSLWNTIEGKPVVGPLVGKGIELESHYLVTTTWGEWKKLHPNTEVLTLNTGHRRDYGEGVAYESYFNNDRLMFPVPQTDDRLDNKDEVLVVRVDGYIDEPLAINTDFLSENKIYTDTINNINFVVLTDTSGANRVYEATSEMLKSYANGVATTESGVAYKVKEDGLYKGENLVAKRLPAHRIFWFAWFNTYPETRLVN